MGGVIASLIVDVAANTVKLQQDVDRINGTLDSMKGFAASAGKMLAEAFTVTAITGLVTKVVGFASNLVDLAAKTQISTRALQAWSLHFGEAGISLDSVTTAALKLSKAIVGGDKSVVDTLEKMGIAVSDLRRLSPEEQFTRVADAVGKIQDPTEKAFAAMTLFGKGGAELLAGLNGELGNSVAKFEEMGLIVSEETLKAADDFGDQLGILAQQLLAVAANVLGPLMPGLTALAEGLAFVGGVIGDVLVGAVKVLQTVFGTLMARIAEMLAFFADMAQKIPLVGEKLSWLGGTADMLRAFAEGTSEAVGNLWVATEKTGQVAAKATPHLLGLGAATERVGKTTAVAAREVDKLHDEMIKAAERGLGVFAKEIKRVGEQDYLPGAIRHMEDLTLTSEGLVRTLEGKTIGALQRTNIGLFTMNTTASKTPGFFDAARQATNSWGQSVLDKFSAIPGRLSDVSGKLSGLLTDFFGGGGVMHTIMSTGMDLIFGEDGVVASMAAKGMSILSGVMDGMLSGIGHAMGRWVSGALGSFVGTLGGIVGSAGFWAALGPIGLFIWGIALGLGSGPGAFEPTPPGQTDPNTGEDFPDYIPQGPPPTVPETQGRSYMGGAAAGRSGGGTTVVHTHVMLDGREVGRSVTEYQEGQYYTRHKTRAA